MKKFVPLLLEIWREACRHIEIGESVAGMTTVLASRLPVGLVMVRRVDLEHSWVETVATGVVGSVSEPAEVKTECKGEAMGRLVNWCREGQVMRGGAESVGDRVPGVLPRGAAGDVLVGPLGREAEPIGVMILGACGGRLFRAEHESMAGALLDPFTAALENDRQVRELSKLRQAAEADKDALLVRLGRENIADTVVGAESGLRPVMERVALVARSDLPVLIFGETGSGKELIARAIHRRSGRSAGPFLRVNCGAIPPDLMDSELFGHERGSFTGAAGMRKGWFERADGGTLFLDEVAELPPAAQVRLLRILQDGTFERVGGQQQLKVDVRIVAATHRDLHGMIGEGRFREDLWYRIAVFPIDLPALRDRPEDIPAMAAYFALRASRRFGLPTLVPSPEDMNLLVSYPWPGNVRELAAVIDRAAILGNGSRMEIAKSLGVDKRRTTMGRDLSAAEPADQDDAGRFLGLDAAMAHHIESALRRTHGRIEGPHGAARLLDVNPHTLRARMRKLGVDWRAFRGGGRLASEGGR